MTLHGLWPLLSRIPGAEAVGAAARRSRGSGVHVTAVPSARAVIAAAAAQSVTGVVLVVTSGAREAEDLALSLEDVLGPGAAVDFPSWETLPHERLSPSAQTVGRRLAVLRLLQSGAAGRGALRAVVVPVRALLQPLVGALGRLAPLQVREGDTLELDGFVRELAARGYERIDLVEKRGQFAVRGGIIDVFPPVAEHPVRIELWGDTVEEIRSFAVADQRSLAHVPEGIEVVPVREIPLTDQVRERARALAASHPALIDVLTRIADGVAVEGMEALAPDLDLALMPVWGWGPRARSSEHLDPLGAAQALRLLRPRVAIPIHWGTLHPVGFRWLRPSTRTDPPHTFARLAAEHAPATEVRVLGIGERTTLLPPGAPAAGG